MRWGHWEMAIAARRAEDQREHFIEVDAARSTTCKFTDWEIINIDVATGFDTAHVEIRLEGYRRVDPDAPRGGDGPGVGAHPRASTSDWVVRPDARRR